MIKKLFKLFTKKKRVKKKEIKKTEKKAEVINFINKSKDNNKIQTEKWKRVKWMI